jgi:carboxyl-terminal processing protease
MRKLSGASVGALTFACLCNSLSIALPRAAAQELPPAKQALALTPAQVQARLADGLDAKLPPPMGSKALAELVWAVADAVAEHHAKPCPREQILLGSMRALYPSPLTPPADLANRAAEIKAPAQLATTYEEILGKSEGADKSKLEQAALQAALKAIPGHSALVDAPSQKEQAVQEQISANRYVGIGIALRKDAGKDDRPRVLNTIARGAARKAGMLAGDVIETVDGKETKDIALGQVVDWLRGDEGTTVIVSVRQPDAKESRTLKMVRAKVPFEHVFGYRRISDEEFDFKVDPSAPIAYVRIGNLSISSLHELRQFERKLHGKGFRALVLDLRGNPGGSLQHASLLCGGLLDGNLMWTVRQVRQAKSQEFRAEHECLFRDWPIAVLIDQSTASAATLIAAALHDSGRATLVGSPAQMDGFVKSIVALPGRKENLVLPTAHVDRPKAELGWPLQPDVAVQNSPEEKKAIMEWATKVEQTDKLLDPKTPSPTDPQLARAVEVLRAELAKANITKNP